MVAHRAGRKVRYPCPSQGVVAHAGYCGHCPQTGAGAQGMGQQWPFLRVFAFDLGSGKPGALLSVRVLSWAQKS
jgi:hypothetical protein